MREGLAKIIMKMCGDARGLQVYCKPRTMEESSLSNQETKRLLIIGLSRTGTSLLQRLLNAFPTVFITYESVYMPFLEDNNRHNVHAYYYEISKQYRHLCFALHDQLPSESLKPFSFEEEFEYFGDKVIYNTSPRFRRNLRRSVNFRTIDKIIFTLRDPRARLLSYVKWIKRRNLTYKHTAPEYQKKEDPALHAAKQSCLWNLYAEDVLEYCKASSHCMMVKYEDLVLHPGNEIKKVVDFLSLDYARYPQNYLARVNAHSVDTWRRELDAKILARVTDLTRRNLEKFSYDQAVELK